MSEPGAADDAAATTRRVVEGLEQSLGITRVLWGLLAPGAAGGDPAAHARELESTFARLQEQARAAWAGAFGGAGAFGAGQGSGGSAGFPGMPGAPGAGFEAAWLEAATQFEWPALGLARERQESAQQLARAGRDFAQAQMRFALLWGQVVREALQALAEKVAASLAEGRAIATPRALYDLWVECGEAAFARHAHSGEFARAQGSLTDAGSTLRTEQRRLVESWSRALDLPTRAELNSVHLRLKELRAELRELRRQLAATGTATPAAAAATGPRRPSKTRATATAATRGARSAAKKRGGRR